MAGTITTNSEFWRLQKRAKGRIYKEMKLL